MNAERNIESDTVVRSGGFQLRPLVLAHDVTWLTDWVNREYAHYWGMQGYSPQQVKAFYQELNTSQPGGVFVGVYQQHSPFASRKGAFGKLCYYFPDAVYFEVGGYKAV